MSNDVRTCEECRSALAITPEPRQDSLRAYAAEHGLCLRCGRWRELVGHRHMNASVRAKGQHYWIGEEPSEEALRRTPDAFGFGGRPFRIEFTDEDRRIREAPIVYTRNLNHQGEIPAHFRDRLFDNAEIREIRVDELGADAPATTEAPAESFTIRNSCDCEDEEGQPLDCGGECVEAGFDRVNEAADAWVARNPSPHGYLIEGRGMGWRRASGTHDWRGEESLYQVIGVVGLWTQRYTFDAHEIRISQSHHDAIGERYTVRAKRADEAD